jgi:hypothetical protein
VKRFPLKGESRRFAELLSRKEAAALRRAARAYALAKEPLDDNDSEGQKLNRRLLKAALAFADAYDGKV